ncbi:kinesin light chain [Rhypophila decipiens]
MRLLSSDASEKLIFTQFKATPPPYAILSHTWEQNNEEVLYEEAINGLGKEKRGYRKIEFCASQAKQDNIQYFWVDTCCIDKWNDVERSKAINSMFHWYRNATKCYVVLSDVSESSFKASRWFTRGWTLQELIAPASVEFFSFEGHLLGDRNSLQHLICEITGIPAEVLQNSAHSFKVSDLKEWAKNRCLLSIFNVFIVASYGEGIDNATKRLENELERIELERIELERISNKTRFMVPYARNNNFVGYESQLAELESMVLDGQQTTKIAITGPGGIGKSQLALELAYRTQQTYKNCSVFWISAADMDSFYQGCSYIAQRLSIPGWDDENQDPRKLLQVHLSRESAGKWLLIYDDADDASLGASKQPSQPVTTLLDFIPQSDHGCIIFTTASSNTAEMLAPENTMQLGKLAAETAAQILCSHLTNCSVANEEQEAKDLLGELSCLPLAITQAAAYIKHKKISIRRYLELLSEQNEKPMKPSDKQCGQQLQYQTTDNPVALTSLISLAQVSRHDTTAANCLFFMACIDRKDVLLQLLPTTPSSPTRTTVDLLSTYAIIIKRPASSAVELHRLVHLTIRKYLQERGLFHQWNQEAISILAETFPSASHENRSKWRRLLPHAKYALRDSSVEQGSDCTIGLAIKYAIALYEDGHFDEAEKLFVQVMETSKTKPGADHPSTMTSMANLASTYRNQGRWDDAEKLFVQVLETRKTKLGADHPDTLTSMANLASTYRDQGRWDDAERLDVQVMETSKTKLGADHPDTLTSMNNLAFTWNDLMKECCFLRTHKLGPEHPHTISSMAAFRIWQQEQDLQHHCWNEELDRREFVTWWYPDKPKHAALQGAEVGWTAHHTGRRDSREGVTAPTLRG